MRIRLGFLVTTVCAGVLAMQGTAQAVPYAFASNQYSDLRLLGSVNGGTPGALAIVGTPTEKVFASAGYGSYPGVVNQLSQPIPIYPVIGTPLDINQAFSGTGAIPSENTFVPAGPGTFSGARADASISAANGSLTSAPGGISVSNVAEGNGTLLGTSTGNNSANIVFQVLLQTQTDLLLSYSNIVNLIVSTDQAGESANASVSNYITITGTQSGSGTSIVPIYYSPDDFNKSLGSADGNGSDSYHFEDTIAYQLASLQAGKYTISISSISYQDTKGVSVPEPASLALLGAGLIGLGLIRRRRRAD